MDIYSLPVPGSGGKTCSQIFEEAGCDVPASPSCGACLGGPRDTYARMNEPQASYSGFMLHIDLLLEIIGFVWSDLDCISVFDPIALLSLAGVCFHHKQELSWQNGSQRRPNIFGFTIYCSCFSFDRICCWSQGLSPVKGMISFVCFHHHRVCLMIYHVVSHPVCNIRETSILNRAIMEVMTVTSTFMWSQWFCYLCLQIYVSFSYISFQIWSFMNICSKSGTWKHVLAVYSLEIDMV